MMKDEITKFFRVQGRTLKNNSPHQITFCNFTIFFLLFFDKLDMNHMTSDISLTILAIHFSFSNKLISKNMLGMEKNF